jgi:ABC-2 type transport system ATP-binding protein
MSAAAIRISGVTRRFGDLVALANVSLDIPARSVFGLVGPNGAGKTTLFSLVAGFLRPHGGSVEVLGVDVRRVSALHGRLAILPQDALFAPNVPILEQLIYLARLAGMERAEARREAALGLERVGLTEVARKISRVLSHGMAKRLGIAQAFLGQPEVILLDEPTAGLDPTNARVIRDLIARSRGNATLIISSHNLPEIQEICTHVAILDRGRLVLSNTIDAVVQRERKVRMVFARALQPAEVEAILAVRGVVAVGADPSGEVSIGLDLQTAGREQDQVVAEIVGKLAAGGLVPRAVNEGDSLEQRYLQVTGKGP